MPRCLSSCGYLLPLAASWLILRAVYACARYRNHVQAGGFSSEALGRIAAKHRLDDQATMKALEKKQKLEMDKLAKSPDYEAGGKAENDLRGRHLEEQWDLEAEQAWGWKGW
eukprot:COSAG01_NODE_1915_length_8918_cov_21.920853_3_plen_112_part_00